MPLAPAELGGALRGLLAFPLTPFGPSGSVDEDVLREHVGNLLEHGASALFAACGTGEFFSLSADEYELVTRACVEEAGGRVPVVGGLGYGVGLAIELAERGARAGVDGFLVMPPYLIAPGQAGLEAHDRHLAARIPRGLVLYQRDNAVFEVETVCRLAAVENIVALKDGIGSTEQLAFLTQALDLDAFPLLNGMPTAELHALNFAAHGVTTYSSAILDFLPHVATRFHDALVHGDLDVARQLRRDVVVPLSLIRRRVPGYAVSLVKAGARLRGLPVGGVRPPLLDPAPEDEAELSALIARWAPEPAPR